MKYLSKVSIMVLILLLIPLLSFAQWEVLKESKTIISVYFSDVNTGWEVGANGTIQKTTNGGTSWVSQTSGTTNQLNKVCFSDVNTGWAVGYSGTILKTSDGGENWVGLTSGSTNDLYAVHFADANTGWAVGIIGTILKTSDGGENWVGLTSGSTNDLYAVHFADVNTGWAVGGFGTILKTSDGGENWVGQTSGADVSLYGVYFTDVNTGWAVGQWGTLLKTTDGGSSWVSQASETTNSLFGVHFFDVNNGWAVGDSGTILNTSNGGISWVGQSSGTVNVLRGVHFIDANNGWAVGPNSTLVKTTDGGVSWVCWTSVSVSLNGVRFTDANNGWVVGNSGNILNTTDGGMSWTIQTSGTTTNLRGLYFSDVNTGWVAGASGSILNTTDGGASWVSQASGTTNQLNGIYFAGDNIGWAVGASGSILKTTDGGASWVSQASGTTNQLNGIYFVDTYIGWVVGNTGTILNTTDGGVSWVVQTSGHTININGVCFTDSNNGWIAVNSRRIFNTTDGGATWVRQTNGASSNLMGVHFTDVNYGWAVGNNGSICKTTDGGANWINQTSGTTNTLNGVCFVDNSFGWAVGNNGTILKHSTIILLSAPILVSPENNTTNQPLNPTLIWQLVENASSYSLQVSLTNDFSEFIINESGIENTEFQLNELNLNTTYFWRVKASNEEGENSAWSDIWSFTTLSVPWQVTQTNNSSTIIVPTSINPMLGDRPFVAGDAIGLFYQNDNNEWACAGYGIWNGTNLGITVWGDYPDTPIKDGFAVGETYTYKVWDAVLGQEWNATATYQEGPDNYQISGFSVLTSLNVNIPIEQNISLNSGWHMISSYIEPENAGIENVFENIATDVKIVKNGIGQMYDPAFNINTIGNWNYADGYLVNMLNDNELTITGTKLLPEETPINLNNGWNLSAYLRDNQMAPTAALASISPSLVLAKDNAGGIFSPVYGINTLGNMQAGQGYYFYMNVAAELTYPANSAQKAVAGDNITPLAKYNIPTIGNTGSNATLLISIENNEGNEIGVYNINNELIGAGAVYNGVSAITIWGDDEATQNIDGAKDNEYLNVKLYNATNNTSKEISLSQIKEITGNTEQNELYYKTNSIFVAKAIAHNESGFAMSIKNIPNPVESNVVFEFSLTDEANAEIQIYTSTGELIASIGNGNYSAGLHRVSFDASNLASGMYNIVLSSGSKKVSTFMVVDK